MWVDPKALPSLVLRDGEGFIEFPPEWKKLDPYVQLELMSDWMWEINNWMNIENNKVSKLAQAVSTRSIKQ
mgnify:CR=1 FL=1